MELKKVKSGGKGSKSVLELKGINKEYGMDGTRVQALTGIDLVIREGESVAIIGPSGSGKSTMLGILGCLERPTGGSVVVDGQDTSLMDDDELSFIRGKKIGFVFQSYFLVPTLTVLENISLPMSLYGVPEEERVERARALAERVGLEERANHKPNELSGGQRQRVAIARALSNKPAVLLADEPTGNLDSKSGEEILNLFEELHHKDGVTFVIVTHDDQVVKRAHRIIRLKDGEIVEDEVNKEISSRIERKKG
jgi:putative ABC transport system ATP-binding protein